MDTVINLKGRKSFIMGRAAQLLCGDGLTKRTYLAKVTGGQREFQRGKEDVELYGGATDSILTFENLADAYYEARYAVRSGSSFYTQMFWFKLADGVATEVARDVVFKN